MTIIIKKILLSTITLLLFTVANARDDALELSIDDALSEGYATGVLDKSIPIYFKGVKRPKYGKKIRSVKTNKKTNAFGKSDEKACQWVLFSALKAFQKTAKKLGGRAVVNIVSNYKGIVYSSPTKFQCGAGNIIAGVALKGDIVR